MSLTLVGAKTNGKYVLVFENSEELECPHIKHIANLGGYTFVFCKETRNPIVIYTGEEIKSEDDVSVLVESLAEKYGLMGDIIESPFFAKLGKAFLKVKGVEFEDVDEDED